MHINHYSTSPAMNHYKTIPIHTYLLSASEDSRTGCGKGVHQGVWFTLLLIPFCRLFCIPASSVAPYQLAKIGQVDSAGAPWVT